MPGQAFLLGAAFRLGGPHRGDGDPHQPCRLRGRGPASRVGRRPALGGAPGLAAALLFVLFPPDAAFAHTAMSESVLTLLSTGLLALLLAARDRPSVWRAVGLALLLGAGVVHHETFLVYVPAAAWVVARWPAPARRRGLWAGAGVLAACLLAALPLYLDRAPYPHVLSEMFESDETPVERAGTLTQNLMANLRGLPIRPREAWEWNHALQWLALVAAAGLGIRRGGERRELAGLAALGFLGTWALLALFYPVGDWRAVRVFMHAIPPALAVIGDALVTRAAGGWRWRDALRLLAPAGVAVVGAASLDAIGRDRALHDAFGRSYSDFLVRGTAGHDVRVVVAPKAYRYGWDAYPVAVVVWNATDLKSVRAVEQQVPVDAIVVRREEKRRFLRGLDDGAYRRPFRPAPGEPFHDRYQLYLAGDERPPLRASAASARPRPPG